MAGETVIFLLHALLGTLVAISCIIFSIVAVIKGMKFSRKIKSCDPESWSAITGGGSLFFWNSMPTLLCRLKTVESELDKDLAVDAKSLAVTMKTCLWLLGIFAVLMILLVELY